MQSAELRIVYEGAEGHALVVSVTLNGFDIYFGFRGRGSEVLLGESYHSTGQSHVKVAGDRKRILNQPRRRVGDFRGAERVWAAAPSAEQLTWSYKIRPETRVRKNLIVDLRVLGEIDPTCDIWLIERGGVSELANIMQSYRGGGYQEFVDCKIIDWTQPWVLGVVWKPKSEFVESLRRYIADSGLPTAGRIGGMVTGPGPPTGNPVYVWPEWEDSPGEEQAETT